MARKKHESAALVKLVEAAPRSELKLDLGCGQNPKEGFEGVDLYGDKAKHKVDLFKFPWTFASGTVDEIHCSHFLEHIPAREIEPRDIREQYLTDTSYLGRDMLCAFMDECWRVMKPDAWMHVIVPTARSNRAFQDPTHRRFFVQESFLYFSRDWRTMNGLDHGYLGSCNFGIDVGHSLPNEEALKSAEAQSQRFHTLWNVTCDWIAKLKKLP